MNLLPAFGLGAMTGMRSMMALAFVSDHAEKEKRQKANPALHPHPAADSDSPQVHGRR